MENEIAEKKDLYESSSNKFLLTKFVFELKTSKLYFWNVLLSLAYIVIYIYMNYCPHIFLMYGVFLF